MTRRVRVSTAKGPLSCRPARRAVLAGINTDNYGPKACGNCVRYGAECPGYDKLRKFIDGKHPVRARRARDTQAIDFSSTPESDTDADADTTPPATQPFSSLTHQQALARWQQSFSNYGGQIQTMRQPGIPVALKEACIPFVYNMMGQLFVIHAREEVVFTAPWFGSMLNYLGTTPVLDAAMCAFMLQLVGKAKRDEADVNRSRDIYGQSLGALQRALNHPVAWKSTETLAATMLCSIYEVSKASTYWLSVPRSHCHSIGRTSQDWIASTIVSLHSLFFS